MRKNVLQFLARKGGGIPRTKGWRCQLMKLCESPQDQHTTNAQAKRLSFSLQQETYVQNLVNYFHETLIDGKPIRHISVCHEKSDKNVSYEDRWDHIGLIHCTQAQAQRLICFIQQGTYVQTSVNYFNKTYTGGTHIRHLSLCLEKRA